VSEKGLRAWYRRMGRRDRGGIPTSCSRSTTRLSFVLPQIRGRLPKSARSAGLTTQETSAPSIWLTAHCRRSLLQNPTRLAHEHPGYADVLEGRRACRSDSCRVEQEHELVEHGRHFVTFDRERQAPGEPCRDPKSERWAHRGTRGYYRDRLTFAIKGLHSTHTTYETREPQADLDQFGLAR